MPEQPTTPDLVERARRSLEAANRREIDRLSSFFRPDAVWEGLAMGTFEGLAAIRGLFEDWINTWEEWEIEPEEILDLGNGVTLAVVVQKGRAAGSVNFIRLRYAEVSTWVDGRIAWNTTYTDMDEARAAATRLAESRG